MGEEGDLLADQSSLNRSAPMRPTRLTFAELSERLLEYVRRIEGIEDLLEGWPGGSSRRIGLGQWTSFPSALTPS